MKSFVEKLESIYDFNFMNKDANQESKKELNDYQRLKKFKDKVIDINNYYPRTYPKRHEGAIAKEFKIEQFAVDEIITAIGNTSDPIIIEMLSDIFAHLVISEHPVMKDIDEQRTLYKKRYENDVTLANMKIAEFNKRWPDGTVPEVVKIKNDRWDEIISELAAMTHKNKFEEDPVELRLILAVLSSGLSKEFKIVGNTTFVYNFSKMREFNPMHTNDIINKALKLYREYEKGEKNWLEMISNQPSALRMAIKFFKIKDTTNV